MPCKRQIMDPLLLTREFEHPEFKSTIIQHYTNRLSGALILFKNNNPDFLLHLKRYPGNTTIERLRFYLKMTKKINCLVCNAEFEILNSDTHTCCSAVCKKALKRQNVTEKNKHKRFKSNGSNLHHKEYRFLIKNQRPLPPLSKAELLSSIDKSNTSGWLMSFKNKYSDQFNYIMNVYKGKHISEKIYNYIHEDDSEKIDNLCKGENCKRCTSFASMSMGYRDYCSTKCSNNTPQFRDRCKKTSLEKYGVEHPMQTKAVCDRQQIAAFKRKDYIFPSGNTWSIQGDEGNIITYLLSSGYSEEQLTQDTPVIDYKFAGRRRKHFPDLYIPSENLIIEVKSPFTFEREKDKNEAKISAAIAAGYEYHFYIWNRLDSTVTIIRDSNLPS